MTPYIKKSGKHTPAVYLNPVKNVFRIEGRSSPEDAALFYFPIIDWFDEFIKETSKEFALEIKLIYYNTSTSKLLLNILTKLEEAYEEGLALKIKWFYPEEDEDIEEAGEEYAEIVDIPFEYISY